MKSNDWATVSHSHLRLMRFFAFIPFPGKTLDYFVSRLLQVYAAFINVIYHSPYTYYAIARISEKVIEIQYICEAVVVQGVFFRYLSLCTNRKKLMAILDSCRELWDHLSDDEIEIVKGFEKRARQFRNVILTNTFMICTNFYATHFVTTASMPKDQKPFVFRFYTEVHVEPWYTTIMIVQFLMAYTIAVQMATMEGVGLYLVMMACGYLRVIRNRLLIFSQKTQSDSDEEIDKEIVECVRFHQKIMLYCQGIESLMSKFYMIAVFTTVYNVSIIGIKLLQNDEDKFTFIAILSNNIFTFFTAQWGPQHLLTESEAIGSAAYYASQRPHPHLKMKTSKTLLMVMLRSQRPIQLTGGGIINLSIETFGAMIRNAFSFFTVLRSFAE